MAVQRRLAAILAADVAGYSRLMGVDEAGTRARLTKLFTTIIAAAGVLILSPSAILAQDAKKPARIGMLRTSPPPPAHVQAFRNGLNELGHVEGRTYILVPAWLMGSGKNLDLKQCGTQGLHVARFRSQFGPGNRAGREGRCAWRQLSPKAKKDTVEL